MSVVAHQTMLTPIAYKEIMYKILNQKIKSSISAFYGSNKPYLVYKREPDDSLYSHFHVLLFRHTDQDYITDMTTCSHI